MEAELLKTYKKLINLMERIENNGTLNRFFDGVEPAPFIEITEGGNDFIPFEKTGFKEINELCLFRIAQNMQVVEATLKKAKALNNYVHDLYEDYKSREEYIKIPDILKFIKDYEEYYGILKGQDEE